jgi:hypothetical protein
MNSRCRAAGDDSKETSMKTRVRTLAALTVGLAALLPAAPPSAWAAADGSKPLLCAVSTIMECDGTGQCHRHTAFQHPDFPAFLRINVDARRITDGTRSGGRTTEIRSASRLDGRLILQGGENGRGWSATIAEDTGRMSAGVVADEFTFALFGACTNP